MSIKKNKENLNLNKVSATVKSESTPKEWTIMVYMVGDNNLSEDMVTGIIGMKKNLINSDKIALLAYYDNSAPNLPTAYFDFTPPIKKYNEANQTKSDDGFQIFRQPMDYERSASEISITTFVSWCKERHPADNYAIIFSGHGDGFQRNSFLHDKQPDSSLTVSQLHSILSNVCKNVLNVEKLDVLGFDSCVMSTIEVGFEMQDVAKLLVSSQGLIPSSGWAYSRLVEELNQKLSIGALTKKDVAEIFAKSFIRDNVDYALYSGRSVDISICNLEKIGGVAEKVYRLGNLLNGILESSPETKEPLKRAILSSHWKCQTHVFDQCVDIKDFCLNLKDECKDILYGSNELLKLLSSTEKQTKKIQRRIQDLKKIVLNLKQIANDSGSKPSGICAEVIEAVENCVKSHYLGAEFQHSYGISLFFPWSCLTYTMTYERYRSFDFSIGEKTPLSDKNLEHSRQNDDEAEKKSGWTVFLENYLLETLREVRQSPRKQPLSEYFFNATPDNFSDNNTAETFKLNQPWSKLNQPWSKLNQPWSRLLDSELNIFRSTKNFPIGWELTDDFAEEEVEEHNTKKAGTI